MTQIDWLYIELKCARDDIRLNRRLFYLCLLFFMASNTSLFFNIYAYMKEPTKLSSFFIGVLAFGTLMTFFQLCDSIFEYFNSKKLVSMLNNIKAGRLEFEYRNKST